MVSGLLRITGRPLRRLALLISVGLAFSVLSLLTQDSHQLMAQEKKRTSRKSGIGKSEPAKTRKQTDKIVADDIEALQAAFQPETESTISFLPEIFRCPECGYEQDEEGNCPDHTQVALVKILSSGRNPMAPAEYDGNEDLIVDIPLKNIEFKKEPVSAVATESEQL